MSISISIHSAPANSNYTAKNKFGIPITTNTRGIANGGLTNNNINSGAYLNSTYGNTTVGSLMALSSNPSKLRVSLFCDSIAL